MPGAPEVPLTEADAEEDDVAGLGVCEDPTPEEIGIGVLQAAGEGEEDHGIERFGHLAVVGALGSHGAPPRNDFSDLQDSTAAAGREDLF